MADFTTIAIFPTCGENSHFPVSGKTVKVQLSLNLLGKITCSTCGEKAIVNSCDCSNRRTDRASASSQLCLGYASTMPHLRLDYALASISCEHCRESRNFPNCVHWHVFYFM